MPFETRQVLICHWKTVQNSKRSMILVLWGRFTHDHGAWHSAHCFFEVHLSHAAFAIVTQPNKLKFNEFPQVGNLHKVDDVEPTSLEASEHYGIFPGGNELSSSRALPLGIITWRTGIQRKSNKMRSYRITDSC